MRGDSVRDLYAKALALMGLAVLGGAGALVDYWPVQSGLPDVAFTFALPALPAPITTALGEPALLIQQKLTQTAPVPAPAMALAVETGPALPVVRTSAPAAVVDFAPSADQPLPTVTVPAEQFVAVPVEAPSLPVPASAVDSGTVASDDALVVGVSDSDPPDSTPDVPRISHASTDTGVTPSSNVLHRAGGEILNVGFAVGTGVAKSFQAFGSAFGHIGRLFAR